MKCIHFVGGTKSIGKIRRTDVCYTGYTYIMSHRKRQIRKYTYMEVKDCRLSISHQLGVLLATYIWRSF